MNIKNRILGFITVSSFLILGCNDDFLERPFLDAISDENFWRTEADMELYLNDLYRRYIGGHGTGTGSDVGMGTGDLRSDILTHSAVGELTVVRGEHVVTTDYGWGFGNLRRINHFLANYDRADVEQDIKDRYAGEARFFRAWEHYNKVKAFGDTPWLGKPLNIDSEELMMARTPRTEGMAKVVEDLDFAIANLPEKEGYIIDSRINRETALHLKARICLFEGTFRKYHNIEGATTFLGLARDAAKALIDTGKFEIYTTGDNPYQDLFNDTDLNGNKEIIMGRKYSTKDEIGHGVSRFLKNLEYGLTKTAVDSYLCTDGLPIGLSPLYQGDEPDYQMEDEFIDRDPRMDQTINRAGENYLETATVPNLTSTGYSLEKYYDEKQEGFDGETDAPVFRYAEILLIYAEAHAELGTCTQAVLDASINLLRSRVSMPALTVSPVVDPNAEFPGLSPLLNEIRRERKVELMFEGYRRDDLMRWKAGSLLERPVLGVRFVASQYPDDFTIETNADGFVDHYARLGIGPNVFDEDKHYFFPLPPDELVLNPNLEQNPGW